MKKVTWDEFRKDGGVAKKLVDERNFIRKSSIAITKITPKVRKLLVKIKLHYLLTLIRYSHKLKSSLNLPIKDGHDTDFPSFHCDIGTVHMALLESRPKEFIMPLGGGVLFLEHILECPFCQRLVVHEESDVDPEVQEKEVVEMIGMIEAEYARRKKIN